MERVISQILVELDGLEELKGVLVIGATNRPDIVDEALLRPGRFDRILQIPLPEKQARREIFNIHTRKKPLSGDVDLEKLAELSDSLTGADIAAICNTAAITAVRDHISTHKEKADEKAKDLSITMSYFEESIRKIKRRHETDYDVPTRRQTPLVTSVEQVSWPIEVPTEARRHSWSGSGPKNRAAWLGPTPRHT